MPDTPSIALLRRLREWDMFSIPSGDNEYWTAEIDKVLATDNKNAPVSDCWESLEHCAKDRDKFMSERAVAREMLHNLSDFIEKCFTTEEWEVAEKEVFYGGNQSLHAVIRHAVTNLRNSVKREQE